MVVFDEDGLEFLQRRMTTNSWTTYILLVMMAPERESPGLALVSNTHYSSSDRS